MKNEKCPKCGFGLVDNNYCVRCGYIKNITIEKMEKYQEPTKEIELYLKEDYLKILHQENILKILILGPFYLGYLNFPILGTVLELINKKIDKLKKLNEKEIFYQHKGHSIPKLFISILLTIFLLIIWVIIYRIIRGNY